MRCQGASSSYITAQSHCLCASEDGRALYLYKKQNTRGCILSSSSGARSGFWVLEKENCRVSRRPSVSFFGDRLISQRRHKSDSVLLPPSYLLDVGMFSFCGSVMMALGPLRRSCRFILLYNRRADWNTGWMGRQLDNLCTHVRICIRTANGVWRRTAVLCRDSEKRDKDYQPSAEQPRAPNCFMPLLSP